MNIVRALLNRHGLKYASSLATIKNVVARLECLVMFEPEITGTGESEPSVSTVWQEDSHYSSQAEVQRNQVSFDDARSFTSDL